MIQILAATPDSAASLGLPGLSAGGDASFMAAMAEALLAKAGGQDQGGGFLPQARPAMPGTFMDTLSAGIQVDGAGQNAAGALLSLLAGSQDSADGTGTGGGEAVLMPDAGVTADAAASLLAMSGLPVPAVPQDTKAAPAEPGVSQVNGKKLPQTMAILAGQARPEAAQLDQEMPSAALARAEAASLLEVVEEGAIPPRGLPATAAASIDSPEAAQPTSVPVSGHEAALQGLRQHAVAAPQDRVMIGMQSGLGTTAWQQELGDRMVWMAGRQGQMAELVLNPPSLGAVEVRLNLSGGEASAQFFSTNPNVRDALEAALPRLREMMGSAGITLGEAMVSDQSPGQRGQAEAQTGSGQGAAVIAAVADDGLAVTLERRNGMALLDYFA